MSSDLHTLTGAYAADALSETERLAFERHLGACPACDQEVRELTETAARLGAVVALPPPAALWDRVRAEAAATRQPTGESAGRNGRAAAEGGSTPLSRRRFPPLLAAAAALLLVAAISVTALNLGLPGQGDRSKGPVDLVAAVLSAPDARRIAAKPGPTGQVAVVVSRRRGQAVFEASGLPEVPAARTYQLWVVDRSGPRPAGLVEPGGAGKVTRLLEGRVTGSEQVAMTVERRGGAARPTSEPVVVVDLRA
ncbi:MAG TPA: anti-sigma factor [Actinomycetes bacterium]|nr:anti-sigma factor [Actinomycetes bacterium]